MQKRPSTTSYQSLRRMIGIGLLCLCSIYSHAETVTVNFRDADIDSVIESIAALIGGTFIVDPRVKGKMTIVSPEPIEADLLYEVFLSALQVHGFQAVNDGAATRIVPLARSINIPTGKAGNQLTTEVISLNFVAANEMVPILKPMMSQGAHLGAHPASNMLVITDTIAQVRRIKGVLNRMDTEDQKSFSVIELNHTSASEIVSIAREMGILTGQSKIVEDTSANRIIVSGPQSSRDQLRALIQSLDTQSNDNSGIDVIYLNYASATTIQPILESMLKSKAFLQITGEGAKQDTNAYTIQADEDNNALIIAAPTAVTSAIKGIIKKLDRPRAQVLIEAVIAEVTEEFSKQLDINIAHVGKTGAFIADFDGVVGSLAAGLTSGASDTSKASALSSLTGAATFGGGHFKDNGTGIAAIIRAIKTDSNNTLLSTPSILTLENEEALISVGKEVPFLTGSFTSSNNGSSNPFQTIEREEIGTILRVKPQINQGDAVRLEIKQEVSSVDQTSISGAIDSVTNKKIIETTVIVNNNQLLILGGLMDNSFSDVERRVPILGDIPLLGRLFRSTIKSNDKTILMVFIRPTIIRNQADGDAISGQKYRLLQDTHSDFIDKNKYGKQIEKLPQDLKDIENIEDLMR